GRQTAGARGVPGGLRPLVWGRNDKATSRALPGPAGGGLRLRLAGSDNRRSLIFVDNLVGATTRAAIDPAAAGRVLLVRDDVDLSTRDLVSALAAGLGRPARLFAVPEAVLATLRSLPAL